MGEVRHNCGVATLHIAPVLAAVFPDLLVWVALAVVFICDGHIVAIVIFPHEGATFVALWVVEVVWIVADMNVIILEILVFICVLMRRPPVEQILDKHYAVLEERVAKVEFYLQFVAESREHGVIGLVA